MHGAPQLAAHWGAAFDPERRAFNCVRVLEIPTPRWTVFDVKKFGRELPKDVATAIRQRACASPIRHAPV